ncbi:MBL fold metallo-hydrolase [Brevundimonas sp. 2R-24]|uniref:MBL fold metallo-hydrolase n=1 Tax=Peiella sedimenti TaxID=3061083 RepID=A0ABT8SKV3_9CAUL|nr:MBL fold metallo-hydrolase [Caulobacteraceae bacterium XZ-24]
MSSLISPLGDTPVANRPDVEGVFDPATHTITYLVSDPATGAAAVIDPVLDFDAAAGRTSTASADRLLARIAELGLKLDWVLETHAHADHLTAATHLRDRTGAKIAIGENIIRVQEGFGPLFDMPDMPNPAVFDHLFEDGERLTLGELDIEVLHTPGHTPACVSYLIGDAVFVGDTLFMPDYGTARCDFPGGDAATLYRSIQRLFALPAETRLFVGHDYLPKDGRKAFAWETTVGQEKAANIHVGGGVSEADFVAMRTARDKTLGMPALILPSLQVNLRAGDLPPPDRQGRRYLRLPLNAV